jgi:SAM-dependent methyltransferase
MTFPERDLAAEREAIAAWNERHAGGDFEGRGPNPTLTRAVGHVAPGRALELGAGSGTNAVWLAQRGWRVTAVDWSSVALANARRQADEAGVELDTQERNMFEWQPPAGAFDLVLLVYLQMPAPQRRQVYPAAARAVAPDGLLLVVAHDPSNVVPGRPSHPDPERLFTAAELAKDLTAADPGLVVERADVVPQDPPPEHNPIDALLVMRRSAS